MTVRHTSSIDKLLDYMPDLIEKTNNMMNRCIQNKKEETQKILKEMQKRGQENNKKENNKKKENKKKEEIEDRIEKTAGKARRMKKEEKIEPDEMYEFEYDETLEDE